MKIKSSIFAASAVFAIGLQSAEAVLVAAWNFNSLSIANASTVGSGGVPTSIAASTGTGAVSLAGWAGTVDDFNGSTLNAVIGDLAEESLSLIAGPGTGTPAIFPANGSFITINFSTVGLHAVVATFATRGSSSGFNASSWDYSTDGTTFTNFAAALTTATTSTTFAIATVDFTSITAINNATSVTLRYTLSGATTSAGNNRIDNLQINAIPEPSSAMLLGAMGILGVLRRRR